MFSSTNQYANASKALFESQLDAFNALTGVVIDGTEKIASLNMATAKSSADDAIATTKEMLAAKDQTAFLSLATELTKPNPEKVAAYGRELGSIVSTINAAYGKAAEAQVAQVQGNVGELVESLAKNAPAGSEDAMAMLKSSFSNANEDYEKMNGVMKQATDDTEDQVSKASDKMVDAVKKATTK